MASATASPGRGAHGITQDVVVLNEFGLSERRRTLKSGKTKSRYSISIETEPVLHDFSEVRLGRDVAETIADTLRQSFAKTTHTVSDQTLEFRNYAADAYARSAPWAVARYSGGRTGATPPMGGSQVGTDSGRLSKTIYIQDVPKEKSWIVNVAANRLTPETSRNHAQYLAMVKRIQDAVPELGNVQALMRHPAVRDEIEASIANMIAVASAKNKQLRGKLLREVGKLARQMATLGNTFGL